MNGWECDDEKARPTVVGTHEPTLFIGKDLSAKSAAVYYSEPKAEEILDLYTQGWSLAKICREKPEMPCYATLLKWARDNESFKARLESARGLRAIHFEDKAIETATNESMTKDDVGPARLAFDALKWGAEVNDPAKYGKRTTISGDASRPVVFQIVSGFPEPTEIQRPPKLGPDGLIEKPVIEAQAVVISEAAKPEPGA